MTGLPLQGIVVLEFCQYLSGPSAGLRLADLGARVIKIEQPVIGEPGRKLSIRDLWIDDNSLLFHTINRNKESFAANLKSNDDLETIKKLITKADVLIHNFRPGILCRAMSLSSEHLHSECASLLIATSEPPHVRNRHATTRCRVHSPHSHRVGHSRDARGTGHR